MAKYNVVYSQLQYEVGTVPQEPVEVVEADTPSLAILAAPDKEGFVATYVTEADDA